jgi:hypothetical protein
MSFRGSAPHESRLRLVKRGLLGIAQQREQCLFELAFVGLCALALRLERGAQPLQMPPARSTPTRMVDGHRQKDHRQHGDGRRNDTHPRALPEQLAIRWPEQVGGPHANHPTAVQNLFRSPLRGSFAKHAPGAKLPRPASAIASRPGLPEQLANFVPKTAAEIQRWP